MDTAAGALGLEVFKILFCFVSVVLGLRCYAQAFSCGFSLMGFPWSSVGKESTCQCRGHGFNPWSGKIPHALEKLSPCITTTEPVCCNY